jgi:hypothetical protein
MSRGWPRGKYMLSTCACIRRMAEEGCRNCDGSSDDTREWQQPESWNARRIWPVRQAIPAKPSTEHSSPLSTDQTTSGRLF